MTVLGEGNSVDCFVDGRKILDVFEADDVEGYAVVYVVENGNIVVDPETGSPVMKWINGKVEFKPYD